MTCVFSVDIYIPSLPQMVNYFQTSEEKVQFTITAGMIGSMLLTVFIGPLSDALGRRKLLIFFQAFFALVTFVAAFSPTIDVLIFMRILQGMANVGGMVLSFAIITDISQGKTIAIRMSYLTTTLTSSLVIAPFIGGLLAHFQDWRLSFWFLSGLTFLSVLCFFFFLPETNTNKTKFSLKMTTQNYRIIFSNKIFLILALIPAFFIGAHIAFNSSASFYFENVIGISPVAFGIYLSIIMASNSLFNYIAGFSIHQYGENTTIKLGLLLCVIGAIAFLFVTFAFPLSPLAIMSAMVLCSGGLGLIFSPLSSESFALFKGMSGAASSALSVIRALNFAIILSLVSVYYEGRLIVLSGAISIATFVSVFLFFLKEKLCSRQKAE